MFGSNQENSDNKKVLNGKNIGVGTVVIGILMAYLTDSVQVGLDFIKSLKITTVEESTCKTNLATASAKLEILEEVKNSCKEVLEDYRKKLNENDKVVEE